MAKHMNKILANKNINFDTEHFDYSVDDSLILVPKKELEKMLEELKNLNTSWADLVTVEDIKKWDDAEEEFKRGETISLEKIREKYDL